MDIDKSKKEMAKPSRERPEKENLAAIHHVVHDYALLVSAGTLIYSTGHKPPVNTHVQYSFLVGCRKFADFFKNNRGLKRQGIPCKAFATKKISIRLPVWDKWHEHMNVHLFHLSYDRTTSKTQWDGRGVNESLLKEFMSAWKTFLAQLDEPYKSEFLKEIADRSGLKEYSGLDLN